MKKHRNHSALLDGRRLRLERGQLLPQRSQRNVYDGVSQYRPLRLERSDGLFQFFDLIHAGGLLPKRSELFTCIIASLLLQSTERSEPSLTQGVFRAIPCVTDSLRHYAI